MHETKQNTKAVSVGRARRDGSWRKFSNNIKTSQEPLCIKGAALKYMKQKLIGELPFPAKLLSRPLEKTAFKAFQKK